jgi:hypothetical protein
MNENKLRTMPDRTLEDDIEFTIAFALGQYRYKPPRTHDCTERDRYFRAVAKTVREQLQRSNFEITKRPPDPGMNLTSIMGGPNFRGTPKP